MKRILWSLGIVAIVLGLFLGSGISGTQAQAPDDLPRITSLPRAPETSTARATAFTEVTATELDLPPLKAVLIVGPIDGNGGSWTEQEKSNMELAATVLETQGVDVQRFYTPHNDWSQIKTAAEGANFLLYRGHGVAWNSVPDVGGFYLDGSQFISSDQIAQDLHLAPNAIVMLYACYSAGTSGSDTSDIGLAEARRRVAQYSEPFLELGAAGYYADWFGDAFEKFLTSLFAGETLGGAYEDYFDFNAATVSRSTHPAYSQAAMWLDKDYWDGFWKYNDAFVGYPDKTLTDLFLEPALGGIPDSIDFVYSIPEGRFLSPTRQVTPQNTGTADPLNWDLQADGEWFTYTPGQGSTPDSFSITPEDFDHDTVDTYAGTLTVSGYVGAESAQQEITVTLRTVDHSFSQVFLPLAARAYSPAH